MVGCQGFPGTRQAREAATAALKMLPNGGNRWQKHPLPWALQSRHVTRVPCFCLGLPASVMRAPCAGSWGCSGLVAPTYAYLLSPAPARSWPWGSGSLLPERKQSGIGFASAALCVSPGAGRGLGSSGHFPDGWAVQPSPMPLAGLWSAGSLAPELFVWPWEKRLIPAGSPHTLLFCYRLCAF